MMFYNQRIHVNNCCPQFKRPVHCVPLVESHFYSKNTWIGETGGFCIIANDDADIHDTMKIDEPVKGSLGSMNVTK